MKINIQELFKVKKEIQDKESTLVTFDDVSNQSNTAEIYKARKSYKEQINDNNLPIGEKNSAGQNLNNQLDTWYKEKNYLKYDYQHRLIAPFFGPEKLKQLQGDFQLLDFAADAAENFFDQFNNQRPGHPKSSLNNLRIVKAYQPIKSYSAHVEEVYIEFFNDVLNEIKNTNKVKNFDDFLNLFYSWFIGKNVAISKAGYYEAANYSIYNTGLAFDFFKVESEIDKQTILNDVRFPVLNYVAKVNGLRIDPNNPNTLIADIQSEKLLELYVKNYFKEKDLSELPTMILDEYFVKQNFFLSSDKVITELFVFLSSAYKRFTNKYPTYIDYAASANISQLYKKKFQTSKIKRQEPQLLLNKDRIKYYIKIRAKENNFNLKSTALDTIAKNVLSLIDVSNSIIFKNKASFAERLAISGQAINYLELFLRNQGSKNNTDKRELVFFWNRGVRKLLTGTEESATLVQEDEEGLLFSVNPTDQTTDFS